jgi:hypothetical protein
MRHRSFFWPFILIAGGIVWLLVELNTIPVENLWALMYILPFLLMAWGVGLILRSFWPMLRGVVSGLTVLGMLLVIFYAPQLGWNRAPSWSAFHLGDWGVFSGSVRGSGVIASETREVADFDSVEINYPAEITVQQGDLYSLTVEAEDNLLPQLSTRVSGNTLVIDNDQPDWNRRVSPTRSVKIHMTIKNLQKVDFPSAGTLVVDNFQTDQLDIFISGAGTTTLSGLTANDLTVDLSGAGSITASGTVDSLNLDISGLGDFRGSDLASRDANITISGAGSATVWARDNLSVDISGAGSVSYYGSPSIHRNISGLGNVNNLGSK